MKRGCIRDWGTLSNQKQLSSYSVSKVALRLQLPVHFYEIIIGDWLCREKSGTWAIFIENGNPSWNVEVSLRNL